MSGNDRMDPRAVAREALGDRSEPRREILRFAEITAFPRDARDTAPHTGFALDESASGLCLQLDAPVPEGSLLRATLRDFDGRLLREEIVRVAWCRARSGGRYNAGLAVVDESGDELLCIRHARRRTEVAVSRPD